jgi:hypothetical protein
MVTPRSLSDQDNARPNATTLPGGLAGPGESVVEPRSQFVRWEFDPPTLVPALVGDRSRRAEHGDHTGDSEDLGPPHEHVR